MKKRGRGRKEHAAGVERAAPEVAPLEELMSSYAAGDGGAFEELHRRASPKLRGLLFQLTPDAELARDVLQMTFVKVHLARHRYRSGSPVLAWMCTIARRTLYDQVRQARFARERLTRNGVLPETTSVGDVGRQVEAAEAIENALARLEPKQREAIHLTALLGMSMSEAADRLGANRETVKTRVHRGRKALRSRAA